MDAFIRHAAADIAARGERELDALVAVSSPSGDLHGLEEAVAVCVALLPAAARVERVPSSTPGSASDLVARLEGRGAKRMLLLGHLDTVVGHDAHTPLRREGPRLYGPGSADMKGGVVLALGLARALARRPELFGQLTLLLVTDEEWRTAPFAHTHRLGRFDVCLCFEAGERAPGGAEGVVVRRKAAGTLRVRAIGRPAHSGSAPEQGANALLALAKAALAVCGRHDPAGADQLSVVPTIIRSGEAFNVVPAAGELVFDVRADRVEAVRALLDAVPVELDGVRLEREMQRLWPGMNSARATRELLERASRRLGRAVVGVARGGASDASHFASSVPLTVDGLGPRGGGVHTPEEFVLAESLRERAEVALAVALEALAPSR
jgi:glutamate carboxypeptidase